MIGVDAIRAEQKRLTQYHRGNVFFFQRLYPEINLTLGGIAFVSTEVIQAAYKILQGVVLADDPLILLVRFGRARFFAANRQKIHGGGIGCGCGNGCRFLRSRVTAKEPFQHTAIEHQRQCHTKGKVTGLFYFGVAAQTQIGNQQQQRSQRQIDHFTGSQQHTGDQQNCQTSGTQCFGPVGTKGGIQYQGSKSKA